MDSGFQVAVKETGPVTVVFVPMKGSYSQIPSAFGRMYQWIEEKGLTPSGPPLGVYITNPQEVGEENALWEVRGPIAGEVPPTPVDEKGVGIKPVPAVRVASTMFKGPYEAIEGAYRQMEAWLAANSYRIAGPYEEVYLNGPAEAKPEDYLTEIRFPITRSQA